MSSIIDIKARRNYPVFESNQVLTSAQLNQMFDYLDQQNRQTRSRLIGIGIVCGLEVSFDSDNQELTISDGVGITSEGFLIHLCDCTVTHYRPYNLPEGVDYLPFGNEDSGVYEQDVVLHELLSKVPAGDSSVKLINDPASFLTDKYILLFLECFDRDFKSCLGKNCDETGKERIFTLRKLVINQSDLDTVLTRSDNVGEFFPGKYDLPTLHLEKPIFQPNTPECSTYAAFVESYRDTLRTTYDELFVGGGGSSGVLAETYSVFEPLLGKIYDFKNPFLEDPVIISQKQSWVSYLENPDSSDPSYLLGIQYFQDFLRDIMDTYHTFRDKASQLMNDCCPKKSFQLHLMLGDAIPDALTRERDVCRSYDYRHRFSAPDIYNLQGTLTEEVIHLHKRLVLMAEQFDMDRLRDPETLADAAIKVTPDRETFAPVEDRTIPHYYEIGNNGTADGVTTLNLEEAWDVVTKRRTCGDSGKKIPSYHNNTITVDPNNPAAPVPTTNWLSTPLLFQHERYSWLRVEGHLGKNQSDVVEHLSLFRTKFNLPFEVRSVKLSSPPAAIVLDPCYWEPLQYDYQVQRAELLCLMQGLFQDAREWLLNIEMPTEEDGPDFKVEDLVSLLEELTEKVAGSEPLELIANVMEQLPSKVEDFELEDFNEAFAELLVATGRCKLLASQLLGLVTNERIEVMPSEIFHTVEQNLMRIIAGFDAFLKHCVYAKLFAIYHHLDSLQQYILEHHPSVFCNFLELHPGIEHRAGVPKGGTFLLVYREEGLPNGEGPTTNDPVVADFYLPYSCCDTCQEVDLEGHEPEPTPPVARPHFVLVEAGDEVIIDVLGNDFDLNAGRLSIEGIELDEGDHSAEVLSEGDYDLIEYQSSEEPGTYRFAYQVTNEEGLSDRSTVEVLVVAPFSLHVQAVDDTSATAAGVPLLIDVLSNDTLYDTTNLELVSANSDVLNASLSLSGNQIRYQVPYKATGMDTFRYRLVDEDRNESSEAEVSVVVYCCHEVDVRWVCRDGLGHFPVQLGGSDNLEIIMAPKNGEAKFNDIIEYKPNVGFVGTDGLTYRIQRTGQGPVYYEMKIIVGDCRKTEVRTVLQNQKASISLFSYEAGDAGLEFFEVSKPPSNGSAGIDNAKQGIISYTPNDQFVGQDSLIFSYQPVGGNRCFGTLFISVICECKDQGFVVTGTVFDDVERPLPGAFVTDIQTKVTVTTGPTGGYTIGSDPQGELGFRADGFLEQRIPVDGQNQIDVFLKRGEVDAGVVNGLVLSPDGEPMPGITVMVKGTSIGAITDAEGRYSITAPADATLVFSGVGFPSKEESIKNRGTIDMRF